MFRALLRSLSGAYNCTSSLWFYRWSVAVGSLLVVVWQITCTLLMMGGDAPETCWATHKRQVRNLWNCYILVIDLFESYDDARSCDSQISLYLSYKYEFLDSAKYTYYTRAIWLWYTVYLQYKTLGTKYLMYLLVGITSYLVLNQRRWGSPKRHTATFCTVLSRRKRTHIKYQFLRIYLATQMLIHMPDRQCEQVASTATPVRQ
jgi:hypothetical protein